MRVPSPSSGTPDIAPVLTLFSILRPTSLLFPFAFLAGNPGSWVPAVSILALHIDELKWDRQIGATHQLNDFLQIIDLFTRHAHLILLDSGLDFHFPVFDHFDDVACRI